MLLLGDQIIMRGPNPYAVWNTDVYAYQADESVEQGIRFILSLATTAPSTFNAQPWKVSHNGTEVKVYLDMSRVPTTSDKTGRFAYISVGCFIQNVLEVASAVGTDAQVEILPQEKGNLRLVAQISMGNRSSNINQPRLKNILARATNRSTNTPRKISEKILSYLSSLILPDVDLIFLGDEVRQELCQISWDADLEIWSAKDFREEHVAWVRNNMTKQFDGMPGFGVGVGLLPSFFARPMILSPIFAKFQAYKNQRSIRSSSSFGVLVAADDHTSWLKVGMSYLKLSLACVEVGIAVPPLGQFIESNTARTRLSKICTNKNLPQMLFRIGYPSAAVPHSPRIPVESIILKSS
jgi:hypothetical protein